MVEPSTRASHTCVVLGLRLHDPVCAPCNRSRPASQDRTSHSQELSAGSFNPPAIISNCEIENTLVGDGCQLRFSKLTNTVLGRNTFVDVGCEISDSVLLGNRRAPAANHHHRNCRMFMA